jgi:hypothetical protein
MRSRPFASHFPYLMRPEQDADPQLRPDADAIEAAPPPPVVRHAPIVCCWCAPTRRVTWRQRE